MCESRVAGLVVLLMVLELVSLAGTRDAFFAEIDPPIGKSNVKQKVFHLESAL